MSRLLKHFLHSPLTTRRLFSASLQAQIQAAINSSEQHHRGEIRFVVEGDWPLRHVLKGQTAHERAIEAFGLAKVWDTEENTGILIYILLCEHHVEILADRGINKVVPAGTWQKICQQMSQDFRQGHIEKGCLDAIESLTQVLRASFPAEHRNNPNELPNAPIVWR